MKHWIFEAIKRTIELMDLKQNWDSYDSPPIDFKCALKCVKFIADNDNYNLPVPNVVPVGGGGIQLEWQYNGNELEIEFIPNENSQFLLILEGVETEGELLCYISILLDPISLDYHLAESKPKIR